jgi:DNA-binding FadR family transcriptional regulator
MASLQLFRSLAQSGDMGTKRSTSGGWRAIKRKRDWWSEHADLRPVSRRPLSAQVADQIRRRITIGDLRPGQRLESERRLARELQVSLPTLREGMAALVYAGLVEVRHGVGVFVQRRVPTAGLVRAARRHAGPSELHSLRVALGTESARLAAARQQSDRKQADLVLLLNERRLAVRFGDPERFAEAEVEFHAHLAGMSGSALHAAIEKAIGLAVRDDLAAMAKRLALDDRLAHLHDRLVDAVDRGQPRAAVAAARAIGLVEGAIGAELDEAGRATGR